MEGYDRIRRWIYPQVSDSYFTPQVHEDQALRLPWQPQQIYQIGCLQKANRYTHIPIHQSFYKRAYTENHWQRYFKMPAMWFTQTQTMLEYRESTATFCSNCITFIYMPDLGRGKLYLFTCEITFLYAFVIQDTSLSLKFLNFHRGYERLKPHSSCLYPRSFVLLELSKVRPPLCWVPAKFSLKSSFRLDFFAPNFV